MITLHVIFHEKTNQEIANIFAERFHTTFQPAADRINTMPRFGKMEFVKSQHTSGLYMFEYQIEWEAEADVLAIWGEQGYHEKATVFIGEDFNIDTPDCYDIVEDTFTPIFTSYDGEAGSITTRYVPRG